MAGADASFPDGTKLRMWVIRDRNARVKDTFPSQTIRVVEGDVVHATVSSSSNTHTIHWHGLEPSPMNDGVGHTSFEISGDYTYQFGARQSGTNIYHCHKNTPLHFERGMYGFLIVDPKKPSTPDAAGVPDPPYRTGGPGFVAAYHPPTHLVRYDVEALWAFDEIDTRWTSLKHQAAMQKCDPDDPMAAQTFSAGGILHDFRPDVFTISGALRRSTDRRPFNEVAVSARVGQTVLVRLLNSGYTVQHHSFGLPATIISMDGQPLGATAASRYSRPVELAAGEEFTTTAAMRKNLLIRPTKPGEYPVDTRFCHWITGRELFRARTYIRVR